MLKVQINDAGKTVLDIASIEVRLSHRGKSDSPTCSAAFASHIVYIAYSLDLENVFTRRGAV
jgi:hypothetical protein